ncbi:tRNA (guanine-N(7)-)-methyltransferase [Xylanimonas cellulosilytica DSM 15894]|uniref:tRNA (guanine-N(7)-)-methyltransferase n=1 Tax=Xylanimonas cellulosilytica (strain DSM 15894 / JCM 12276 / CECT 5975 / KCTC 9989 / LMG 20990 / NBRC 107835 / XIL07) TaxID=446471 RepID=D1BZF0_XYLCX|nr:tRNA (guanosine(46)-N7)-methyltransferase TrmB [Xylanimonas cellulosilytica]ACZ30104.1 tRNA (guanine-N(7)-)-methyltransferase [Xylanimonas cellulosilytica DSM 15894]
MPDAIPLPDDPPHEAPRSAAGTGEGSGNAADVVGPTFRTQPVSFVRRSGRLTTAQQKAWDTRRDEYLVEVPRAIARTSVDPAWTFDAEAVFGRRAPLVLEIGSGQGENVVAAADAHPEKDFVAVEVYLPGLAQTVVRAGQRRDRRGLTNLRLLQVNAAELLATSLPEGSLDELWVFFPDPWHKSRHHKRRLVTPELAALAARVLRPGGVWRLATDWVEYAEQMREVCEADPHLRNAHGPGAAAPRFEGRVLTAFERKGIAAGRTVTDLEYVRR